jgi:uncharacterized protein
MKWTRGGRSADIIDRRGMRAPGGGGLGGISRLPIGRMGLGGVVLLIIIGLLGGGGILGGGDGGGGGTATRPGVAPPPGAGGEDDEMMQFMSFVLDDLQAMWEARMSGKYRRAKLVVFTDATQSACGLGQSAMGPFYCPADERVFIDLGFFRELDRRFGAPGDFAQAYVLAHEVGHHVQNVLGINEEMRRAQRARPGEANQLSVRLELQADCFAGVWGHTAARRNLLEPGDVEEGLRAAAAVGDDRMQKQSGGRVSPESWTHGSAEQRARWFRKGLESGDPAVCDTFGGAAL